MYKWRCPGNASIMKHSLPEAPKKEERNTKLTKQTRNNKPRSTIKEEVQQRSHLRTVSTKTAGSLNQFYSRETSPLILIQLQTINICLVCKHGSLPYLWNYSRLCNGTNVVCYVLYCLLFFFLFFVFFFSYSKLYPKLTIFFRKIYPTFILFFIFLFFFHSLSTFCCILFFCLQSKLVNYIDLYLFPN